MGSQDAAPQRTNARRNRERVLEVALAELSVDPETPLSAIGRKAGVGQATLYRNFPNREALILEVYRREARQLARGADDLLETSTPLEAMREWMSRLARFAVVKSGFGDALSAAARPRGDPRSPGYAMVHGAIDRLLEANRAAGTIRPDVTADDFLLTVAGVFRVDPRGDWEPQVERVLDVVMAGLRA